MPKMKMKFDFSRVKAFLLAKGERIALGVCGGIALLLLAVTFMGAMGAGKPTKSSQPTWDKAFATQTAALNSKIKSAFEAVEPEPGTGTGTGTTDGPPPNEGVWGEVRPIDQQNPFFQLPDPVDTNRRRPLILSPRDERVFEQVFQGGSFAYDFDLKSKKVDVFKTGGVGGPAGVGGPMPPMGGVGGVAGTEPLPVKLFRPIRLVVVSAVFPLKAQMEMYRTALRHPTMEDLLAKGDIPKAVGLIVYRSEKNSDGSWTKAQALYDANPKTGETKIDYKNFTQTYELFWRGMFDTLEPNIFGPQAIGGLMTPLPLMANAEIPAPKLMGITVDETLRLKVGVGGVGPMGGVPMMPAPMGGGGLPGFPGTQGKDGGDAGGGVVMLTEPVSVEKFPMQKERFLGTLNAFPAREALLGFSMGIGAEGGPGPGPMPPVVAGMPPMGGEPWIPGKDGFGGIMPPEDAVIRFVDADVLPGKTYKYWVKVRFANPSFGPRWEKEVAFPELTKELEIASANWWEVPREVSIPNEFFYYVVDETPRADIRDGSDHPRRVHAKDDSIAMQIHQWIRVTTHEGRDVPIGDWAIAERLVIRKGEFIGRQTVKVELAEWEKKQNAFRLNTRAEKIKKGKGEVTGIAVDFSGDFSLSRTIPRKYALVDFEGGKLRTKVGALTLNEETAIEALILTPDGNLTVHNSQDDLSAAPRVRRVENWRKRIDEISKAGFGGGGLPGVGGSP